MVIFPNSFEIDVVRPTRIHSTSCANSVKANIFPIYSVSFIRMIYQKQSSLRVCVLYNFKGLRSGHGM